MGVYKIKQGYDSSKTDMYDRLFALAFYEDEFYKKQGVDFSKESVPPDFQESIRYCLASGYSSGIRDEQEISAFLLAFDYDKCKTSDPETFDMIFGIKCDRTVWPYKEEIHDRVSALGDKVLFVLSIAVEPDKRRKGYATALVKDLIASYPEYTIVGDVSATESLPIYRNLGFEVTEIEPDYNLVILHR